MEDATHYLRQFMQERTGVLLGADKDYLVHSRLHAVLRAAKLPHLCALARSVQENPAGELAQQVISALATHETSWFRDRRPFERLRREVLPVWRASPKRNLRIWSAACSTGQEPYSIAMLLHSEGLCAPEWSIAVKASDVCEAVLCQARSANFSALDMERGLPESLRDQYFTVQDGGWQLKTAIAQSVVFERVNLVDCSNSVPAFDLIFCRNVLIYFDRPTQHKVLRALHSCLLPGGLLFLGASESPLGLHDDLVPWRKGSGVYCRREDAHA